MANPGDDFTGKTGWILGWGLYEVGGLLRSVILQQAEVTVHDQEYCEDLHGDIMGEGQICLGNPGISGSCTSDSGGPLVVDGVLVGVTSWGSNSCNPDYPSVYESVAFYRQWIQEKINV